MRGSCSYTRLAALLLSSGMGMHETGLEKGQRDAWNTVKNVRPAFRLRLFDARLSPLRYEIGVVM